MFTNLKLFDLFFASKDVGTRVKRALLVAEIPQTRIKRQKDNSGSLPSRHVATRIAEVGLAALEYAAGDATTGLACVLNSTKHNEVVRTAVERATHFQTHIIEPPRTIGASKCADVISYDGNSSGDVLFVCFCLVPNSFLNAAIRSFEKKISKHLQGSVQRLQRDVGAVRKEPRIFAMGRVGLRVWCFQVTRCRQGMGCAFRFLPSRFATALIFSLRMFVSS